MLKKLTKQVGTGKPEFRLLVSTSKCDLRVDEDTAYQCTAFVYRIEYPAQKVGKRTGYGASIRSAKEDAKRQIDGELGIKTANEIWNN